LKDNLVSYGPVSIACDASEWSSYTGGVFSSSDCSSSAFKLDHAIQLVGYNAEASTPYWIVRNSWDTTWGEDGYIYLEMGVNACGIADKAAIVQL
jgi:C1A family cysteine protease